MVRRYASSTVDGWSVRASRSCAQRRIVVPPTTLLSRLAPRVACRGGVSIAGYEAREQCLM